MTASWERLAEATDGRYTGADFERAAYQLLVEQVVYAADRGSATPYHLLVTYAAAFKDVLDRLGVTMQHNHHHNYVVALARHRVGPRMRLSETRLALVLRRLYDDAIHRADVTDGEALVGLEDLERAYGELLGRPFPSKGELDDLLQALRRYGIAKIEGAEDPLQPYHVVIRAGIVDVLGESALLQLAAHGVDAEEGSDEAA